MVRPVWLPQVVLLLVQNISKTEIRRKRLPLQPLLLHRTGRLRHSLHISKVLPILSVAVTPNSKVMAAFVKIGNISMIRALR
jgi:hypothetical protein